MKRKVKVSMASLALVTAFSLASVTSADYNAGGRSSAQFNAWYDSSVASYGYTGIYDSARASWGGISSRVAVGKTTSSAGTPDKYYVGTTTDPELMGLASYFNASGSPVCITCTRAYTTVALYNNNLPNNYSYRLSAAIHEIGHSLSLAHTSNELTNSVMQPWLQNIGVQQYDMNQLKAKWGV
ncbi:matrixin family metalloprotease [Paenibacillus sp. 1P07SE]|uniref:matrixin family metalloprotease n=1 Tax=Paenibacillus sp. 1P07SE TaxID=3132209 RepID=UPI0039A6E20C